MDIQVCAVSVQGVEGDLWLDAAGFVHVVVDLVFGGHFFHVFLDEMYSTLSLQAKILYSLFLDRMALSRKNSWFDDDNRVYIIYPITEIQSDLGFSRKKAMEYLAELESFGLV